MICENFDTVINSLLSSSRFSGLLLGLLYISEEIKFKEKFEESVLAQIKLNNNEMLLLGCIYKSPSSSPENLDELNKLLMNFISSDFSFLLIYNAAPRLLKLVDSLRNSS
jgi:hypothetical protein